MDGEAKTKIKGIQGGQRTGRVCQALQLVFSYDQNEPHSEIEVGDAAGEAQEAKGSMGSHRWIERTDGAVGKALRRIRVESNIQINGAAGNSAPPRGLIRREMGRIEPRTRRDPWKGRSR